MSFLNDHPAVRSGVTVLCLASSFIFGSPINGIAQTLSPGGRGTAAKRLSVASVGAVPEKSGRKTGNSRDLVATPHALKTAREVASPIPGAAPMPVSAHSCTVSAAERLLEEKQIERIVAKVVEALAAKFDEMPAQRTATSTESARAADSLKREFTQYRKEVKDLTDHMKDLSAYTKEIENSFSGIDASLSTPSVLRKKLEQQQNGLKP